MPNNKDMTSPVVAHYVWEYLCPRANWIYNQIHGLERYQPVVLSGSARNAADYPMEKLYFYPPSFFQRRYLRGLARTAGRLLGGEDAYFTKILRNSGARLLHAHYGPQGFRAMKLKEGANLPLVVTFYGYDVIKVPRDPAWARRYKELFARADHFLTEGSHMKACLVDLGCPPERITVQHLGAEMSKIEFRPRVLDDGPVRVLMAAAFVEKKGFVDGIHAFAKASRSRSMELTIIGDGPLRPQIEAAIAEERLENVRLLGYQPYAVLMAEAERAHIFMHPSVTAANGDTEGGAPVCLIDMQASGLPVISTTHADIPEVVIDGRTGLLVPEHDIDGLAERLNYLVDHPQTWSVMGAAGRAHVQKEYDIAEQRRKLEIIYDRLSGN